VDRYILFQDDYKNHKDIPALPFSKALKTIQKPKPKHYPRHPVTIGDQIKRRRMDLGLLQEDLARIIGVTESSITNWETNRFGVQRRFLKKVTKFLE